MANTDYNGTLQDFVNGIAEGIKTAKHKGDGDSFTIYPSQFQSEIAKLHDTSDVIIPFSDGKTDFILSGYNAYTAAGKIAGAMPDKRGWAPEAPLAPDKSITIPKGYHDGTKSVTARALDTEEVTFTIDPNTTEWENNAIVITPTSGKDGMSSVTFQYKDDNSTKYTVTENDTIEPQDISNYKTLIVNSVSRAVTEPILAQATENGSRITNQATVTVTNDQAPGYFSDTGTKIISKTLALSSSGSYVYLKDDKENELAHQQVAIGTLANPTFSFNSNTAIVTATSTLTKAGYLTKDTTTSNTFPVPTAVRATNTVDVSWNDISDGQGGYTGSLPTVTVSNNQDEGYVKKGYHTTTVAIDEAVVDGAFKVYPVVDNETYYDENFSVTINPASISAEGPEVTVTSGYIGASGLSTKVTEATRAATTLSSQVSNNQLIMTAVNSQETGYVKEDADKNTAQRTIALSIDKNDGAKVIASDGVNSIEKSVITTTRANTTITASEDHGNLFQVTASNNQAEGYQLGGNRGASMDISTDTDTTNNTPVR